MSARRRLLPPSVVDNGQELSPTPPTVQEVEQALWAKGSELIAYCKSQKTSLMEVENALWSQVLTVGKLLWVLFLLTRQQRQQEQLGKSVQIDGQTYRPAGVQPRNLNTLFGVVRYFRTYLRGEQGRGHYPLDAELGLTGDRVSMGVLSVAARLWTMLSYAKARSVLCWFLGQAPSTEVIERTVLGLGRRAESFFEQAQAPKEDGEVLIIQIDSKGAPMATDTEMQRRRGPRQKRPGAPSPRHRGRHRRDKWGKRPRRQKGDTSKNAKMATVCVMYTLKKEQRDGSQWLLGPLNKRVYARFAPKKHAFAFARREADKRGFTKDSGKLVQLLTDGDEDLACYAKTSFPEALHTVDVMHVVEYLYKAGECLYKEGSPELAAFIEQQKEWLYGGNEARLGSELERRLRALPLRGPGNKGRRERLSQIVNYLQKRLPQMNYQALAEQDLELATGAAEGAVKYLLGARFDVGGSRWIRERAEALLKLRCIDQNGDWDAFISSVHHHHQERSVKRADRIRIQQSSPPPLPTLRAAA